MKRAFTLIELLIVVAIIAILAAIAVPNFLEAQMRAKITRCEADMRTIATAIEAYRIDYNSILGTNDNPVPAGTTLKDQYLLAYVRLTTPIAYLSSALMDPFYGNRADGRGINKGTYEFRSFNKTSTGLFLQANRLGYRYGLCTIGPTLYRDVDPNMMTVLVGTFPGFVYDATNGTISRGPIIRTDRGKYKS